MENPEHPPLRITQPYIDRLEKWCDQYNADLPALNSFVLPGVHRCPRSCTLRALWCAAPSVRRGQRWMLIPQGSARCRQSI
ncbi:cob(I)yrinic acid a,c-diamide adenosyltransferase [Mycobacterium xenopi 3993]|nr:cob(I)yrinic acid a,c-diamide adenosyltransferase [Mycobacterium xenopi 3993]